MKKTGILKLDAMNKLDGFPDYNSTQLAEEFKKFFANFATHLTHKYTQNIV